MTRYLPLVLPQFYVPPGLQCGQSQLRVRVAVAQSKVLNQGIAKGSEPGCQGGPSTGLWPGGKAGTTWVPPYQRNRPETAEGEGKDNRDAAPRARA